MMSTDGLRVLPAAVIDNEAEVSAPYLNPIKRYWGVMHKYDTHNKFYETYNEFAKAILDFFARTLPEQWRNFRVITQNDFRILE